MIKRIAGTTLCVVLTVAVAIGISHVASINQWPVITAAILGAVFSAKLIQP